jgi:lysophospholipase L1-like esterase
LRRGESHPLEAIFVTHHPYGFTGDHQMRISRWHIAMLVLALGFTPTLRAAVKSFYLHNGDRILFYGDSITEQRYYPVAVQTYVRTRFPNLRVKFVDSAVGGARVIGNWAVSSEKQSLERDVYPFHPNIVTIMLGMNDAMYQPFKQSIFNTYVKGYNYIIAQLQKNLPGVQIVLIEPSPWDDVTHTPSYFHNPNHLPGGYNDTLKRYCAFVRKLGAEHHFMVVDFNTPMVKLLQRAEQSDPAVAQKIIPGRVHPSASGQLAMAQLLLKAWNAPATVTTVALSAHRDRVKKSLNTVVTGLTTTGQDISWNQTDNALPYPIMTLHSTKWPQFPPDPLGDFIPTIYWSLPPLEGSAINPVAKMVVHIMRMYQNLDREMLRVKGLSADSYTLTIDGEHIGTFTRQQLSHGINLARYQTPMMTQADKLVTEIWHQEDLRFDAWRGIQVPLRDDKTPGVQSGINHLIDTLYRQDFAMDATERTMAKPIPHHYELLPQ